MWCNLKAERCRVAAVVVAVVVAVVAVAGEQEELAWVPVVLVVLVEVALSTEILAHPPQVVPLQVLTELQLDPEPRVDLGSKQVVALVALVLALTL